MQHLRKASIVLVVALTVSAVCASAAQRPEYVPGELLVKFKGTVSKQDTLSAHAKIGSQVIKHFDFIGVDHIKLAEKKTVKEAMAEYLALPEVKYAEPNYYRYLQALPDDPVYPNDPRFDEQWGLHNTGQPVNGVAGVADADIDAP